MFGLGAATADFAFFGAEEAGCDAGGRTAEEWADGCGVHVVGGSGGLGASESSGEEEGVGGG